jgi:hypothetical protein
MRGRPILLLLSVLSACTRSAGSTDDGQQGALSGGDLPRPIVVQVLINAPVFAALPTEDAPPATLTVLPPGQLLTAVEKHVGVPNPSWSDAGAYLVDGETTFYKVYFGDPGSTVEDHAGYIVSLVTQEVSDASRPQAGAAASTVAATTIFSYPQESSFARLFDASAEDAVQIGQIPSGANLRLLMLANVGALEPSFWYYEESEDYGDGWILGANLVVE